MRADPRLQGPGQQASSVENHALCLPVILWLRRRSKQVSSEIPELITCIVILCVLPSGIAMLMQSSIPSFSVGAETSNA